MGLIKFGIAVSAISGKVSGNVFARNKAGAYVRNWAKPTTTPTPLQTLTRAQFAGQSTSWFALSAAKKAAWNAGATGLLRLNALGDSYVPTGRQVYTESNQNNVQSGAAVISDPPANFNAPNVIESTAYIATETAGVLDGLQITDDLNPTSNMRPIIEATPTVSNAKNNVKNMFRFVEAFGPGSNPYDILLSYIALFGNAAIAGQVIYLRYSVVDSTNGMRSPRIIVPLTIT